MNIAQDTVVTFQYVLTDTTSNEILESSEKNKPMVYLHGHSGIMPALEKAFEEKALGDKFTVALAPGEAYGHVQENASHRVPIKHLAGAKKWKPDMIATIRNEQGEHQVRVVKVGHTMATIDTNHPMAGKSLTFDIEVIDVRAASHEELHHGHAHGPGGHQH